MTIKNGDLPAYPSIDETKSIMSDDGAYVSAIGINYGLTKREMFCLYHGVAETGDAELDEIIKKGNRQKASIAAMQGLLAKDDDRQAHNVALQAVQNADALLVELECTK